MAKKKTKTPEAKPARKKKRKYTKRAAKRGRPPGKASVRRKGSVGRGRSEPVTLHGIVGAVVELTAKLSKERQTFVLDQVKQHLEAPE